MKIAVIIGHEKRSPGATNFLGESEYAWNAEVATFMLERCRMYPGMEVKVFRRDFIGREGVSAAVGLWDPDLCIELHFNAAGYVAFGCEVLVLEGDKESAIVADKLTDILAAKFDLKERRTTKLVPVEMDGDGVFEMDRKGRGYWNLKYVKNQGVRICLLIEPCFMDTRHKESEAVIKGQEEYANLMIDFFASELMGAA